MEGLVVHEEIKDRNCVEKRRHPEDIVPTVAGTDS